MLSFVVQNFHKHSSCMVRTKKYNSLVLLYATNIIYLLLKYNVHNIFYRQEVVKGMLNMLRIRSLHFTKPLWSLSKKIDDCRYGLYTNNISKSYTYHTINNLLTYPKWDSSFRITSLPNGLAAYVRHTPIVALPFRLSMYNTVVLYFLRLLVDNYSTPRLHFRLQHNFVITPHVFTIYCFLNSFYFRIWNY